MSKLVALIEAKLGERQPANRPALALVQPPARPPRLFDSATRESHLRMIRHKNRRWKLQMLVDQATFGRYGLDGLEDQELLQLHHDCDRAVECIADGVTWEEAGLIRQCGG